MATLVSAAMLGGLRKVISLEADNKDTIGRGRADAAILFPHRPRDRCGEWCFVEVCGSRIGVRLHHLKGGSFSRPTLVRNGNEKIEEN